MTLEFGDVDFSEYNALVFPVDTLVTPIMSYDKVEIAGRNGELYFSNDRYKNVPLEYTVIIMNDFDNVYDELRAKIADQVGYQKLVDSTRQGEYRLGYLNKDINPVTINNRKHGKFLLSLSAKPQRFLEIGDEWVSIADVSSITITNPTMYTAHPVLRIYGAGTVSCGGGIVTVSANSYGYIDVDCETMNADYDGVNANEYVSFDKKGNSNCSR